MSYTYAQWVTAVANLIVETESRAEFQGILPSCIDYAEQRLYRELDLLNTVTRDYAPLTAGNRNFFLPQANGRFVVTNGFNVITPALSPIVENATRHQMVPASRDYLDAVWGSAAGAGLPKLYAPVTDQLFVVGPWPDANYSIEVIGTIRPTPLSASNPTTYLTLYLPDLWFATTMVFMAGWQQNFGAQADNPQMAQSWETQRNTLLGSANIEEQRKRYAAGAWGSLSPTPNATPSR
jgi:hypothetical protein